MSISTGRYINGQWTTRQVDVHHILAQNRQKELRKNSTSGLHTPQRPPLIGCLSQKLSESSVIKWIIPARIRHESKNDVVFIHDTYIQIREVGNILKEGAMKTVAVKADFDSSIRSARVFGSPRKYINPLPEGLDAIVKTEEMEDTEPSAPLRPEIPPHILVMALESNCLVFLTCFHDNDGRVQFISYERALPAQESDSEQLGQFIAVDPKSRAIAVAALEGSFTLYGLKTMADIKRETEVGGEIRSENFRPVKGEKHILVDGVILKMEFLHPSEGDDDHIVLLIIVSSNRQSRLICYEWDSRSELENVQSKGNGQRIRSDEQLPLLLVPLQKSTAFMLVYENRITVYRDILTGNATAHALSLHHLEPPEEPGGSRRLPIWTHWARPSRHDLHVKKQDNIYLCREDGVVHFLEIKDTVAQMIDCTHKVGILGLNIDTAFASIDLGARGCDLLVVGGDMCNGGRWLFEPCESANKMFSIPSYTPLIDFTVDNGTRQSHQRLFACTGRGSRYGAIVEIRYGIEAFKNVTIELSHPGVTQIWALEFAQNDNPSILILLSYPTTTCSVMLDSKGISHNQRGETGSEIDYNSRTIVAAATRIGLIIQVTDKSVRVVLPNLQKMLFYQEENIMTACLQVVEDDNVIAILLTVIQKQNDMYLQLGRLVSENQQVVYQSMGEPIFLPYELSFISLEIIQGELMVFVADINSTIQTYHGSSHSGLTPIFEHRFEGQVAVCESIAVLTMDTQMKSNYFLVCGLRNGFIEVFFLNPRSSGSDFLVFREKLNIGNTSVMVKTDKTDPSRVIILCEQTLYTFEYPSDNPPGSQAPAIVKSIWLTESEFPSFQQGKIDSLTQTCLSFARGWFLCVEQSQIHIASLSSEPSPALVPRYMPLEGTPTRIIYSVRLKKLIVLYQKISINARIPTNGHQIRANQRRLNCMIALVDPDINTDSIKLEPNDEDENKSPTISQGKPGERFLGVTEWYPEGNSVVHHMLVVNTMVMHLPPRQPSGRVLFFSVSVAGALTLKKTIDKDAPVYSLAPYGLSSLVYCYGADICFHHLEITSNGKKWQDPVILPLRSRGLHISVHQAFVYVTTSEYGLAIFKVEDHKLIHQLNDERTRDDLYHLTLPEQSLILTSQKSRTIGGLWQPSEKRINNSTSTVFEAKLPGSITRFRCINRPLWQQSFNSEKPSEAIIGSSTDGSMFQFEILDESSWRLLVFIQNMAYRNTDICPYANIVQAHRQLLVPSPESPLNMHVNGDVLRRLITRGGERTLLAMLGKEHILKILMGHEQILLIMLRQLPMHSQIDDHEYMEPDEVAEEIASKEAEARQGQMIELAKEVGLTGDNGQELVQKVVQWMRHKLQRAI